MKHLTPDELIDAMERSLSADRQAHLAACEACRAQLAAVSMTLGDALEAAVPEPSPLFWRHFSARVRSAIDRDGDPVSRRPSWLRWQVLAPLGVAVTIILGWIVAVPRPQAGDAPLALQAPEAPQAPDNWVMITELVGEIELDVASAAGVIEPGVAEEAVLQLTAEEQQELTRLLKAELQRAKS